MNQLIENAIVSAAAAVVIAKARLESAKRDPLMMNATIGAAMRDYGFAKANLSDLKQRYMITNEDIQLLKPKVMAVVRKVVGDE